MSETERIAAAIDALEQLQKSATPGWWGTHENILGNIRVRDADRWIVAETYGTAAEDEAHANAELIVTLHRTIDAQLVILRSEQAHVAHTRQVPLDEPFPVINRVASPHDVTRFEVDGAWLARKRPPRGVASLFPAPETSVITESELVELDPTLTLWLPVRPAENVVALADAILGVTS